jgi:hypothetical protein
MSLRRRKRICSESRYTLPGSVHDTGKGTIASRELNTSNFFPAGMGDMKNSRFQGYFSGGRAFRKLHPFPLDNNRLVNAGCKSTANITCPSSMASFNIFIRGIPRAICKIASVRWLSFD